MATDSSEYLYPTSGEEMKWYGSTTVSASTPYSSATPDYEWTYVPSTSGYLLTYKEIKKKSMKLTSIAKRLFDSDTKKLVNAELLNGDLSLTEKGKYELEALMVEKFKAELIKAAEEIIAEKETK